MRKTVFAAIIGYTGEVTRDNRVLMAPEEGKLRHRPYPLPVLAVISERVRTIGAIEMAALCDRRIIVFGRIDPEYANSGVVRALRLGEFWFELDLDDVDAFYVDDAIRFESWRLAAVTCGRAPAWRLPPVVIEDLNFKEKTTNA